MASSELPPSKKKSAPTTISCLGDDLLCEVFLRLPSLPTLVRAALTCPAFLRAVRSSPKFRRRFRDLHPPPLLGVFLDIYKPAMPAFVPIRCRSDPDHAAAVRGADVFLTRVPDVEEEDDEEEDDADVFVTRAPDGEGDDEDEGQGEGEGNDEVEEEDEGEGDDEVEDEDEGEDEDEDESEVDKHRWSMAGYRAAEGEGDSPRWSMTECRDGYVVLVNETVDGGTKRVAVYDPLTRGLHLLPAPPEEICGDPEDTAVEFHVVTPEEDRRSLRVVCIGKKREELRVAVFSLGSRKWQISPEAVSLQLYGEDNGTLVNGCVYWATGADIHVLNTATLQFSRIERHPHMRQGFKIGETSDGELCVAEATSSPGLYVWVRRADDSGVEKWIQDRPFGMDAIGELELEFVDELPVLSLHVVAIIGGTVYLSIFQPSLPSASGWFLYFCIETEELKKVCPISRSESSYPYLMAWPPVLVSNKANSLG